MLNIPDKNNLRMTEYVCEKCEHSQIECPGEAFIKCNRTYCNGIAHPNGDLTAFIRHIDPTKEK